MSDVAKGRALSPSTGEDFLSCEMKYFYKQVYGIDLPKGLPAKVGTCLHDVYNTYYDTRLTFGVEKALAVLEAKWPGDEPEWPAHTLERCKKIVPAYHVKWRNDGIETVHPADEENVELEVPGTDIKLRFKMDRLVKWNGMYWVLEHKTVQQLGPTGFKRFDPNLQLAAYIWASRRLGLPYKPVGAIVDITYITTSKIDFFRDTVTKTELQDLEFERVFRQIAAGIVRAGVEGYRPSWNQCTMYGECPFRRVCMADPAIRARVLESEYQRKEQSDGSAGS